MAYSIRDINLDDFESIYKRIESDFAPGEYAPYTILYGQLQEGIQKGFVLIEGERTVAYSICAGENSSEYVLINLLAVYKEYRGSGFGTVFLEALKERYSDKKGIIIEVEKPEKALNDEEKSICEKRIAFYQKSDFYLIPGIEYSIWGIPMHLMALPHKVSKKVINKEVGQIIYEIYRTIIGKHLIDKVKFRMLT